MHGIRETAEERTARIEYLIAEMEATREMAAQQLISAQRRINEAEAVLKRLRDELAQYQKSS